MSSPPSATPAEEEEDWYDWVEEEEPEQQTTTTSAEKEEMIVQSEPNPAPLTLRPTLPPTPSPTTRQPTRPPSGKPTQKPTRSPTKLPTKPPLSALPPASVNIPAPSHELLAQIGSVLVDAATGITNEVLLRINVVTNEKHPTELYQYSGFINALGVISKGDLGSSYFYLGPNGIEGGANYGLANAALFLAQAAVETVQFNICDEISWEKDVFGR